MPVVNLRLPEIENRLNGRPQRCPYCESQILQRWGKVSKSITDTEDQVAGGYRYRCYECKRTFRGYPQGIDRSNQSKRIRRLAAIATALGMSSRDAADIFTEMGITLSHTTIWRDGKELRAHLNGQKELELLRKYSVDTHYIHTISNKLGVVVVVELEPGEYKIIGTLDEINPRLVASWLESLVSDIDIEVLLHETGILASDGLRVENLN
jgi:DNA-directed RNA polymerase subunit RPC12/RpoP